MTTLTLLEDAIATLDEGFVLFDADDRLVTANERYRQINEGAAHAMTPGTSRAEVTAAIVAADAFEGVEDWPTILEAERAAGDANSRKRTDVTHRDGRLFTLSRSPTAEGGCTIVWSDVTDRRRAEARTLRIMDAMFQSMEVGVILWDENLCFVTANASYKELYPSFEPKPGEPLATHIARNIANGVLASPKGGTEHDVAESFVGMIRACVKDVEIPMADGRVFLCTSARTELGGYLVTYRDITFERTADRMATAFAQYDSNLKLVSANRAFAQVVSPAATNDGPESLPALLTRLVEGERVVLPDGLSRSDYVDRLVDLVRENAKGIELALFDGRTFQGDCEAAENGGHLLTLHDVTARAWVSDVLDDFVESVDYGLCLFDAEWRLIRTNKAYRDIFTPFSGPQLPGERAQAIAERLKAAGFYDAGGDALDGLVVRLFDAAEDSAGPVEIPLTDGRRLHANRWPTPSGGYLLTFADVTERLNAEENARAILEGAIQSLDEGIAMYDADFRFVLANRRWRELFCRSIPYPEPGESAAVTVQRLIDADHYILPPELTRHPGGAVAAVLKQGQDLETDYEMRFTDGRTVLASALRTPQGGYMFTFREITARLEMEAELRRQRDLAHQSEKMSALGELLAGVAHELNNPLSVVSGYSMMLAEEADGGVSDKARRIEAAAERCGRIVRMFLAMARQRPQQLQRASLAEIAATACEVGGYGLRASGAEMRVDVPADLPPVEVDADQIAQVLSNLLVNAEQAMRGLSVPKVVTLTARAKGAVVELDVTDTGPGIPAALRARIFEPFVTTKGVGEGTGIGLSFAHRIAAAHGGSLTLLDDRTKGAGFRLTLPVAAADLAPAMPQADLASLAGLRVLIVDDEPDVVAMLSDMLTRRDCVVRSTTEPAVALRLIAAERFDAILSDMKMPSMTGAELHDAVARADRALADRMVFMTGDSLTPWVQSFLAARARPHLEKPLVTDTVLRALATIASERTNA
ncbi:PAS-domain containing protein [Jannaschia sp. LMIT008]|uniref:PAS-domain containing protein n=1 Tax=Jannaschia maritima TaxID=3032585 RepID=UPI00281200BE|nr:PAS-domain containing protein [Jannaschia sp. LMIT008]